METRSREVPDTRSPEEIWYTILEIKPLKGRINYQGRNRRVRCKYCGSETWKSFELIKRTQSCGCRVKENRQKTRKKRGTGHGMVHRNVYFPEHAAWIRFRSWAKKQKPFPIAVHPAWNDFPTWLKDVGYRPHPDRCFTRINPDHGFVPGNVEWRPRAALDNYHKTEKPVDYLGPPKLTTSKYFLKKQGRTNPIKG